jgi:mannose-1-phosphate guanylyltransferase/mannose-6-phosphate isomerase
MQIQPVILSGGSGTRLWPASREHYPKQLIALVDQDTLLQSTLKRFAGIPHAAPLVVCNEEYRFLTAEQLRAAGTTARSIVLEPTGRNTAPALTLAALNLADEDPVMAVMPADHVINNVAAFQQALKEAAALAQGGAVVTFGVLADRPETGYGYIQAGAVVSSAGCARALARFVEKPDRETAEKYLASGDYLWNSGIFVLRARTWLNALAHFRPDILAACKEAVAAGKKDADFFRVSRDIFNACPSDSIDYAVMEKLPQAAALGIPVHVVPLDAGWSDVGAWDALWAVAQKDASGNATRGDVMLADTRDSLVHADSRMVALVGVKDLVVVETPDAVMVADKAHTQEVKTIVNRLKADKRSEASSHRKVHRPWGYYDSIDHGPRFQVKRIVVSPGASLSLQMHHHRAEHWVVVRGTARVTCGEKVFLLAENESTFIPIGTTHRLENPGKVALEIIEVQSGEYLGEDDIVRFEDTYGRG